MNEFDFKEELEACKEHLEGEEILWMGRPALNEEDERISMLAGIIVFCAIIAAFLFKTMEAYITGGLFVLFAFFFCGGWDNAENIRRMNTFYVITKRKIIRKQNNKIDFTYTSFQHNLEVSTHKNGYGTIVFLDIPIARLMTHEFRKETDMKNFFYLDNIPNVRNVEKLIRDLGERE